MSHAGEDHVYLKDSVRVCLYLHTASVAGSFMHLADAISHNITVDTIIKDVCI